MRKRDCVKFEGPVGGAVCFILQNCNYLLLKHNFSVGFIVVEVVAKEISDLEGYSYISLGNIFWRAQLVVKRDYCAFRDSCLAIGQHVEDAVPGEDKRDYHHDIRYKAA